jgi:hypothetical protein
MGNRSELVIVPLLTKNIFDIAVFITTALIFDGAGAMLAYERAEPQKEVGRFPTLAVYAEVVVRFTYLHVEVRFQVGLLAQFARLELWMAFIFLRGIRTGAHIDILEAHGGVDARWRGSRVLVNAVDINLHCIFNIFIILLNIISK